MKVNAAIKKSAWRKLVWFAAIYLVSILVFAALVGLLRFAFR